MRHQNGSFVAFLVLALAASACIALGCRYTGTAVPIGTPDDLPARVSKSSVVVGAESYADAEDAERVFGEDVTDEFWPVLVVVRNENSDFVMIDIGATRLVSADGKTSTAASAGEMYREHKLGEDDAYTAGALAGGALGGAIAQSEADAANDAMFRDWNDKELTSYLIGGGKTKGGFLYFRRNEGKPPYRVELVVEQRDTGEQVTIVVPFK
jgi:hypothetical protein